MTTTNNEISDDQISQLRDAAGEAGDHAQVLLCDLALGRVELDEDTTIESLRIAKFLDADDKRRISEMDPADYRAACEDVIRDAQAQAD